ncbi:patatin-like phospholipase family protein [uncultured Aquabacterium sp.]|uniref:patatin-like phospholipase family protein n=1 Tax=uncultured Aquabacterium sp. TaxID=158753 RepID=UPI0025E16AE4|nr:patatin-like phospholipase family protein [uncultured Aquabacterium sp.]
MIELFLARFLHAVWAVTWRGRLRPQGITFGVVAGLLGLALVGEGRAQPSSAAEVRPVAPSAAEQTASGRPRTGLVLSGGGARGLAHVGVLKVLERERIPVDVIAGTSMGAIVGGLYASGMDARTIEEEVRKLDWNNVFASRVDRQNLNQRRKEQDFEVSPVVEVGIGWDGVKAPLGSVSSRGLESRLRRLTLGARQIEHFDQLPTPFRAVATDMETGQAMILDRGDLATALRSSMSVPGIFAPVEVQGRILGDGGLVNNTPVDVARAMGAQRLIVVNIGTPLAGRDTLSSFTGVTAQMINILTEQNVQTSLRSLGPQDVLIAPKLDGLTSADFDRAREFVLLGELQAEALVLRMQDLKVSESEYAAWLAARQQRTMPAVPLHFVRFEGSERTKPANRSDILATQPGQRFDVAKAERDTTVLAATGDYLRTDYRLVRDELGREGLVFELEDKPWGPNYLQMGVDFVADNRGRSAFNLKLVHNRHWLDEHGSEWRNAVRIGSAPGLASEWYRPMDWRLPDGLSGFVAVQGSHQREQLNYYADPDKDISAQVDRGRTALNLDLGANWRELGEIRLGLVDELRRDRITLAADGAQFRALLPDGVARWRERGVRLRAVFDQLDHAFFPTRGWRIEATAQWAQSIRRHDSPAASEGFVRHLYAQGQWVRSWGDHTLNLGGRVGLSDGAMPLAPRYGLGGFQQLSGYGTYQVSGQQLGLVRAVYQVRLAGTGFTRGLFLGTSVEAGNTWSRPEQFWQGRKRVGTSLYLGRDTVVGPVYAAVLHSPAVGPTLMVFVGRP